MNRSLQQNKLYHEYCCQLKAHSVIKIYDGRFNIIGYKNPIVFRPSAFSYDTFRELMKAFDLDFKRDESGKTVSSVKLNKEEMSSHIMFLQVLLMEIE